MASTKKRKRYSVLETDASVKIGAEAYGAARRKVAVEKGPAGQQTCAYRGCKEPGKVYKLKAKASEVFIAPNAAGEPKGPRFSRQAEDYRAFCEEHSRPAKKAPAMATAKAK